MIHPIVLKNYFALQFSVELCAALLLQLVELVDGDVLQFSVELCRL